VVPGGHPVRPPRGAGPPARARVAPVSGIAARGGAVARRRHRRLHRVAPLLPQGRREAVAGGHPLRGHPPPPAPAFLPGVHELLHHHAQRWLLWFGLLVAFIVDRGRGGCGWPPCCGSTELCGRRRSAPDPTRPATTPRPVPRRRAWWPRGMREWSPVTPTSRSCRWWGMASMPTPGVGPPRWSAGSRGSAFPTPSSPCTASPMSR
jgi:hypothetical protein